MTTYGYDPATGELTGIDYSDTTADIGFVYDRLGRQHQITDAVGSRTFAYNDHLQLESESITGLYSQVIARTYETTGVPGRATGLNLGADYGVTYGYQSATGRFETLAWNIAGRTDTATYAYAPDSDLLQQLSTTSGRRTTYAYEPQRNLKTQVQNRFNTQLISQYDYRYDEIGRRTSAANSGTAFTQAAFSAYGYNDRSELTSAQRYLGADIANTTQPVPAEQRGYLYDPIGNRTQAQAEAAITTYAPANAVNQYTAITTHSAVYTPSYDPDGNLQNAPNGLRYIYDAENRLIEAAPQSPASGDIRVQFVYDYMGRRVQKKVYTYASSAFSLQSTHLYVYDGWNLIKKTTTLASGTSVDKYFVWGLDLSQSLQGAGGVSGLLASVQGSLTYHYFFDANGNVGQVVEAGNGSIAAHYEYDPYGNELRAVGPMAGENEYRFSTKYYDSEVNLYYYGFRYYSPVVGRWISRDPKYESDGPNLYGFVHNNVINKIDLYGLWGASTHSEMTKTAFNNAAILEQWGKTYKISSRMHYLIIDFLQESNVGVDKNNVTFEDNRWHFNRDIEQDTDEKIKKAISDYVELLLGTWKEAEGYVSDPSKINCVKALKSIGMLSHAWQDYYAHAINWDSDGSKGTIGRVAGDPDSPGDKMKPASWGSIYFNFGEHGTSEPGARAPDYGNRLTEATIFTRRKYSTFFNKWLEPCLCQVQQIIDQK
ncbi:MAG: RHS repeat-associated core domain-containing protein [Desulfobacteraceae bacterium]|nr:RHS repeat-associated core domain-containing protein [Desulfobacteraceae bacterium]